MDRRVWIACILWMALGASSGRAQIFGTVRGSVLDPQGLPIAEATVRLKAQGSAWTEEVQTESAGLFILTAVPAGAYTIEVAHLGFRTISQLLNVAIGSAPVLQFSLELSEVSTAVEVSAAALEVTHPDASSPPATVNELQIERTPGANRSNSLAFITNFAPGSFMLHDHVHMRGGHQVSWLVDGVPVPNTNISSNVARQLDPKDIQTVEISRGGYSAEYGDRTYGMINIVPRSGFEFHRSAELKLSYGSFHQTNNQLSLGGHTERFAYYASVNGSRTNLGLEPPTIEVIHDQGSGLGAFTSLTYEVTPADQLRLAASLRHDRYQIPNTPADQALGIRDVDRERDGFVNFSWVHTAGPGTLLTVSPFYHYNRGVYEGGANDPIVTTSDRTSNYVGGQTTLGVVRGAHNLHAGLIGFYQHDGALFRVVESGTGLSVTQHRPFAGGVANLFVDDQYKPLQWLTLNLGLRLTHFSGGVSENAATPRIGVAARVPHLDWVFRAFYGRYYQTPPLSTITGSLLKFAVSEGLGFLPLRGERDQQIEFGVTIPLHGWVADFSHFATNAKNFADHDVLGNSNLSLPLSIDATHIRAWEATLRSPQVWRRGRFHLAYSNMVAKGRGNVSGGLTDFAPPSGGDFYIDHDQLNTLSFGGEVVLPHQSWVSAAVIYGSGFLDGDGPQHLPQHTTLDLALGKSFGERWSFTLTVINIANNRYLLGRESSFAGTHYNDPRQFIGEMRYHFHY
jgi:outer membrane receptor protein involved in Fe transport